MGGCTKDELNSEDDHCEASFFDHQVQDETLAVIIDSLIVRDLNQNFTNQISLDYGYPLWEHAIIISDEYVREYRIQLVKPNEKEVNSIWVFSETYNSVRIKILDKNKDAEIIGDQDWEFLYMTEKIFGYKEKPIFNEVDNHTKRMVWGYSTKCFWQEGYSEGRYLGSRFVCRSSFGYMEALTIPGPRDFEFSGGGIYSGSGSSTRPKPLPKVIEDKSFKKNPCASAILFSLKTGRSAYKYDANSNKYIPDTNLSQSILKFFNNSKRASITYSIGSLPSNVNGHCDDVENKTGIYIITLKDSYAEKATDLAIARTLIHETIHAHLSYIIQGLTYSEKLKSNEWHALNEIYNDIPYKGEDRLEKTHHEYMAGIANLIGNCLYDWASANKKNITRAYCSNMAWAGLLDTDTFRKKVKNKEFNKDEIINNLLSEQENYSNSKGQTCVE